MELTDDVVTLGPWRHDDLDDLVEAIDDVDIARWMPKIPFPYTIDHGRVFLARSVEQEGRCAIVDVRAGRLLGGIAVGARSWGRAEVGYWVRRDARGRGVATRALVLLTQWGLERYRRLQLHADVENVASQRVAEKAGFRREGILRSWIEQDGIPRDHVLYSRLRSDR